MIIGILAFSSFNLFAGTWFSCKSGCCYKNDNGTVANYYKHVPAGGCGTLNSIAPHRGEGDGLRSPDSDNINQQGDMEQQYNQDPAQYNDPYAGSDMLQAR